MPSEKEIKAAEAAQVIYEALIERHWNHSFAEPFARDLARRLSAAEKEREGETRALAEQIAEAMAEHANRDRYVLEHGWQSTGVEPPEYDRSDYEDIAQFIADRVQPREGDIIEKLREWAKAEHDATVGWDAMGTRAVTLLLARLDTFLNDLQEQSTPKEEA